MKRSSSIKTVLGVTIILVCSLFAQKDYSVEWGFNGFIPNTISKEFTRNDNKITLNQGAFWLQDKDPLFSQGMFFEFLFNENKKSKGFGYEFHHDYHFALSNSYAGESLSNFISFRNTDFALYAKYLLHLKKDYKASIFIGAKAGVIFHLTGFAERLTNTLITNLVKDTNNNMIPDTKRDGEIKTESAFKSIELQNFMPGAYISLILGVKIPFGFLRPLLDKSKKNKLGFGLRITSEFTIGTPSAYNTIENYYGSPSYTQDAKFNIRYIGFKAGISIYTRFRKIHKID